MNIDDRIQQCTKDIEALKANLTKLEAEKTEWHPKFGDVLLRHDGEPRLVDTNGNAVDIHGQECGNSEFVKSNDLWWDGRPSYTKLGNIFEGYQWPVK